MCTYYIILTTVYSDILYLDDPHTQLFKLCGNLTVLILLHDQDGVSWCHPAQVMLTGWVFHTNVFSPVIVL